MKPILFLSVLLALTACASNSAVGTSRSGFIAQCTSRFNGRANTAQLRRLCACTYDTVRSHYSAREWQRVTTAYDRGQSNPVLERQMNAAANSCVRRYPVH